MKMCMNTKQPKHIIYIHLSRYLGMNAYQYLKIYENIFSGSAHKTRKQHLV